MESAALPELLNLGVAGLALWLMYKLYDKSQDNQRRLSDSIDENTKATLELYNYIRVRNGTLERIAQKDKEIKAAVRQTLQS